jgi:hypothetical protein
MSGFYGPIESGSPADVISANNNVRVDWLFVSETRGVMRGGHFSITNLLHYLLGICCLIIENRMLNSLLEYEPYCITIVNRRQQ